MYFNQLIRHLSIVLTYSTARSTVQDNNAGTYSTVHRIQLLKTISTLSRVRDRPNNPRFICFPQVHCTCNVNTLHSSTCIYIMYTLQNIIDDFIRLQVYSETNQLIPFTKGNTCTCMYTCTALALSMG